MFYYNKNHFKAAGLPDRAPKTWDEWKVWAKKLQDAKTGAQHAYQFPSVTDYAGWTLQNILWVYGAGWSKKDSFDVICDSETSALLKENPLIGQAIKQLDATRPQDYARVFLPGGDQEIAKAIASVIQQGTVLKPP
ncbi:extracellular solute-binding protein [Cutibacterium sp.]|uniref:extracellular solute-binding protein n=1 Tax=Cutibacterium sp. TaxID=1912221 RepID=UPI0026DDAD68|nr:extracellular solute-binding protein [Cutibacterium sp.]MDO4412259.1 extracellular solute-binding protein [Cutibacterium sp.]